MNKTTNKPIKQKTKAEIEEEVGMTVAAFEKEKKFNEDTPLQYTNAVVIKQLKRNAEEKDGKTKYDERGFVGSAVKMYQTDYKQYRQLLEAAGYTYER